MSANKIIEVSAIYLASLYLVQLHLTRFIESSHQSFFRGKKLLKLRFLDYFSKAKTEECDQEDWSVSDKFGIITTSSATYHLEMGAPVSLKVATKACFGGKKNSGNLDF